MNFVKRATLSITRKVGKNITLLILVFILGNIMVGGIAVKQAVKNTENNLRNQIGAVATLELDYEKMGDKVDYDKIKYLSAKEIEKIGELSYVKYYDYTSTVSLETTKLKRYQDENGGMVIYDKIAGDSDTTYFSFQGVQNKEVFDIKFNKIKLVEGRTFNEEEITSVKNVILISKTVAQLNNLTVGSKVTLSNIIYDYSKGGMELYDDRTSLPAPTMNVYAKQDLEFEIIGIFDPVKEAKKNTDTGYDYQLEELQNRFYTTNKVVNLINEFSASKYKELDPENYENYNNEYLTPLFVLNDPNELDNFKKEVTDLVPDYYKVTDNSNSLNTIAAPMENMDWIASVVLYVALVATLIILSLLITLFIRDRKHEMGIYLSLGESRKNVVLQIVLEVVIVAFAGITLSLISGSMIANSISKEMLRNQIIADEEKKNNGGGTIVDDSTNTLDWMGYGSTVTTEELIESYKVSIGVTTILLFYLVGLGTVMISTISPTVYIIRLNPKKIMM